MALSAQNKNFLAVLNKLGIDIDQFPDKTFDGLFENVPEITSYFFNWFIENITPDNALTQSEEAIYFHLESQDYLGNKDDKFLSNHDLKELNIYYINSYLPQELEDLKKSSGKLSDLSTALDSNCSDIKKKQNKLKEEINLKKNQLILAKQYCHEMNLLFGTKVEEVISVLLKIPNVCLKIDLLNELLTKEDNIFNELESSKLLDSEIIKFSKMESLFTLKEDLACVESALIISEGFLKANKTKVEYLLELLQKENPLEIFNDYFLMTSEEGLNNEIYEEIRVLESQLFHKKKTTSHSQLQDIYDQYLAEKINLQKLYLSKLSSCKNYIISNCKINSYLLHILIICITYLDYSANLRKQLFAKLNDYETNFTSDIANLELRQRRFTEVSVSNSKLQALFAIDNEEALKGLTMQHVLKMLQHTNDDSNFITQECRNQLQFAIKGWFDNTLCGPTSQLMFAPVELLNKFHECKECEGSLSLVMKRLASKYVNAKETMSKSERKRLLLWIDFLTNPQALITKCSTPQS